MQLACTYKVNIKNNKLNIINLKIHKQLFNKALYILRIAYYKIKFGYSQVLFMGSVPRINHLLAIVSWEGSSDPSPFVDYIQTSVTNL